MTQDQFDRKFEAVTDGLTNAEVSRQLYVLLDLNEGLACWPENIEPKTMRLLWT